MPLNETSGNLTTDAFGGGVAAVPNWIEDCFSTWLYKGTGANQSIVNGIDLSTNGGLTWIKARNSATAQVLIDTARGNLYALNSNSTNAQTTSSTGYDLTSFNSNGFSLGPDFQQSENTSGNTYVSWTFRKQPKFFDIVTYTGDGTNGRAIAHNLGSAPKFVIIKCTSNDGTNWVCGMAGEGALDYIQLSLNTTDAGNSQSYGTGGLFYSAPTSTNITINQYSFFNGAGRTYVAYLFAHNAGGFGLTGTDNVISCGSYTGNGSASGPIVTLGYEPQWLMVKKTSNATNSNWFIVDNMRGFTADGSDTTLYPNLSNAEGLFNPAIAPTATGFQILNTGSTYNESGSTYIYIAIRRGPMKVPTDATKVFSPITGNDNTALTTGFPVDMFIDNLRTGNSFNSQVASRLTGNTNSLQTSSTSAELTSLISNPAVWQSNTSFQPSIFYSANGINFAFGRAPSFFDVVCYTGTGSATTVTHNLGVAPELMIVKSRSDVYGWYVYNQTIGATNGLVLNTTAASTSVSIWNSTAPTSSVFSIQSSSGVNLSGGTYVAYLFATCAGVSKVFTFTGNGTTQTINCGFTGGARFVLLKASSATGGWYVYDTARGMTVLTDPYLFLNSTAAETATLGSVTTATTGFAVNEAITTGVNTSGVTYIGFAIA